MSVIRLAGDGKENSKPGPGARGPGPLSLISASCGALCWFPVTGVSLQVAGTAGDVGRLGSEEAVGSEAGRREGSGQSLFGKSPPAGKAAQPECGADVRL